MRQAELKTFHRRLVSVLGALEELKEIEFDSLDDLEDWIVFLAARAYVMAEDPDEHPDILAADRVDEEGGR